MPPWALPFLDTAYVPASSMLGPLLQPRSLGPPPGGPSLVHISAHFPATAPYLWGFSWESWADSFLVQMVFHLPAG